VWTTLERPDEQRRDAENTESDHRRPGPGASEVVDDEPGEARDDRDVDQVEPSGNQQPARKVRHPVRPGSRPPGPAPPPAGIDPEWLAGERMRQVVLAFLSDGTLMFNSVLPYGVPFQTHRLTSLDQSVWFHRDTNPGDWMLFDQRSTAAADGRGMNTGEIYSADGRLVMSCTQESMLRRIESQS
jgi:hypothetical protein